jgi:acetyl-CoA synthetase
LQPKAHIKSLEEYEAMYKRSVEQPEEFWAEAASELEWFAPWDKVLEGEMGSAKWFTGGKLNLSHNCVDRHANGARRDKVALLWEGEPGEVRRITYGELHSLVQRFANVLKDLGIKRGDRVAIYMGMCPELAIAMLACARIGAVHSVIFGGFAAQAIVDRVNDSACVAVLTQDVSYRRGTEVRLKDIVDEAIDRCPTVKNVVVYRRAKPGGNPVAMKEGRDVWWQDLMAAAAEECAAEWMDAEDLLYILYTSGTTGKPKGLVHTTGGYSVQSYLTSKYVFDLREDDVYWCTADIGWVTGHSYVVYGPLQNGATVMMYEGAPNFPANDRFWKIIDDHKVSIFYTAPTAIRAFIKWGDEWVHKHSLSVAAAAGNGRRADQSRGVDVVSPRDWQGALPDRGYVVADGDGHDHDLADPRRGRDQAGLGDAALLRHRARSGDQAGRAGAAGPGRAAGGAQAVAVDGADGLGR